MGRWADYAKGALLRALQRETPTGKAAPIDASSSVLPGLRLYDQFTRIGGEMTPETLAAIYRQADNGYTWQFVDLSNECRQKDGHLQGILEQRESALRPLTLQVDPFIEPGATKATTADVKVADSLRSAIKRCKGLPSRRGVRAVGLQDLKKHLQGGNYFGYAMAEIVWAKDFGGLLCPTGFYCHSARRFGFREEDGALVHWDQVGSRANGIQTEVQAAQPYRWIQHQPRITGDVPAREGYGRVLNLMAIFRNWDISDLLRLAEMTWKPYRIGRYKAGASDKDINLLKQVLWSLTNNGVATMSENVNIELKWPEKGQSSGSNHLSVAEFFGKEMSKTVLHGTLMTEAGDRGARSLGEVHERGFDSIVEDDAGNGGDTLERDLAIPFVRMNYGDNAGVPTLTLITQDEADLVSFGNGVKILSRDCGLKVPVKWVRDRTGVPEPEDGEEVLGGEDEEVDMSEPEPGAEKPEAEAPEQEAEPEESTEEMMGEGSEPSMPPMQGKPAKGRKPKK